MTSRKTMLILDVILLAVTMGYTLVMVLSGSGLILKVIGATGIFLSSMNLTIDLRRRQ